MKTIVILHHSEIGLIENKEHRLCLEEHYEIHLDVMKTCNLPIHRPSEDNGNYGVGWENITYRVVTYTEPEISI